MSYRWSRTRLDALLDEAAVRGTLSVTLESEDAAKSLRWALYSRRTSGERLSLSGSTVTISVTHEPELIIN